MFNLQIRIIFLCGNEIFQIGDENFKSDCAGIITVISAESGNNVRNLNSDQECFVHFTLMLLEKAQFMWKLMINPRLEQG